MNKCPACVLKVFEPEMGPALEHQGRVALAQDVVGGLKPLAMAGVTLPGCCMGSLGTAGALHRLHGARVPAVFG